MTYGSRAAWAALIAIIIIIAVGWWIKNPNVTKSDSPYQTANVLLTSSGQTSSIMSKLITLQTNLGKITIGLYEQDAPNTVANFSKLVSAGYYNGLTFHRVIPGFMIQGGDPNCSPESAKAPTTGPCGTGGPGYQFADELNPGTPSYQAGYRKGVVAMANSGPNTNGSQFFIMLEDYQLPNNYTIFGQVTAGQEIVDQIGQTKTDAGDRPTTPITILSATVNES